MDQACTGKRAQATQVDVYLVKAVVARNVARQHARIRGVNVCADQGDTHARLGLHGEHAQHAHMAVAAADQHQIAQHGLIGRLHSKDPEVLHPTVQGGAFGLRFKQGSAQSALMLQVCHQSTTGLW